MVPQNASRAVEINHTNINMPALYSVLCCTLNFVLWTLNRLGMYALTVFSAINVHPVVAVGEEKNLVLAEVNGNVPVNGIKVEEI